MNSSPITLRLRSGSVTPARRARKRSSAGTTTSGTWKWSRNWATTCSASLRRSRPWSTNTHVSWSPIARWTSSAATDESTPPERAQIARPSPTCSRTWRIWSAATRAAVHSRRAPQTSVRQVARRALERGHRRARRRGERREPRRWLVHAVAVAHPARLVVRETGEQASRLAHGELRATELPRLGELDAAPKVVGHHLHPVADAEHRNVETEQLGAQPRGPLGVHGGRAPGEDQAEGLAPEDLLERRVVGQQLREDAALAHPPSDELRVLAAEVEHEHLLGGGSTRGRRRACVRCPARRAVRRGGALGACARSHPDLLRGGSRGPGRRGLGHPCRKLPAGAPFGSAATATSGGPPTGTSSRSAAGDSAEPSPGSSSEASGPSCEGRLGGAAIAARVAPMPIDCSRWSTLPSV